ncbi:MAG: sigma-70 family RNA polymerase sigma factor [Acidimicrobiales bacterium]|jgi:RNA polymerase primary sigma factor
MARINNESQDKDLVRLYLDTIGRYPLLTREDEARLAQAIQEGREAKEELASSTVNPARRRQLQWSAQRGDAATVEFINSNLRLVVSIAKRYQSQELPLLDLVQEGNLGLMHAVGKFDWRKGFKFSTYATWWIRQAISRGIDNTGRTIRLPVHAREQVRRVVQIKRQFEDRNGRSPSLSELADMLDIPHAQVVQLLLEGSEPISLDSPVDANGETELGDLVADSSSPSPFDTVTQAMLGGEVDKLLSVLDEREKEVVRLRFGLGGEDPRTLEEVGTALHLTRERIRQIERTALSKLRHPSAYPESGGLLAS